MKIATIIISIIILLITLINFINSKKFIRYFKQGNTCVSGLRGAGKDLAFCYVINKRKQNYISNIQYSSPKKRYKRFEFDTKVWELAGNTYEDLVENKIKEYVYPYPDGIDYYISDSGIYFPSQYHKELEKRYKSAPMFQALSRHLGDCNIHVNTQNQCRVWDKIREQSDIYIVMNGIYFIPKTKIFLATYTYYALEESAEKKIKIPKFGIGKKAKELKLSFMLTNGEIKKGWFIGKLPYSYDSRRFKRILEGNLKDYEN